jgi:acyl carrier protein
MTSKEISELVVNTVSQTLSDSGELSIAISPETILFGEGSIIDSLTLVNVIVDLEEMLFEKYNEPYCLTDDDAVFREPSPFSSVNSLTDYIIELLGKN